MQAGITPIFKVFGMTGPSTNQESNQQNLLVGARPPPPLIVAFYDQQGLLRTYWSPGAPTPDPHGVEVQGGGHTKFYLVARMGGAGEVKRFGPAILPFCAPHLPVSNE